MKEGDFVFIESIIHNEGENDENYTTYSGIISYETETTVGFEKAVVHKIYKNSKTYVKVSEAFSVDKKWLKL